MNTWKVMVLGAFLLLSSCAYTPKIKKGTGAGPIAEMKQITIGGINQSLLIRGANRDNPVILFVHGGPGKGEMPLLRCFNPDLEKDFTIATWDQRGAGKSNRILKPVSDFSLEAYLSDTYEVTQYLKEYLGKDKIIIMGHSWGSLLALLTVDRHPGDYYAYIGMGQMIGYQQNIGRSCELAYDLAIQYNNIKAQKKMEHILANLGDMSLISHKDILYLKKFLIKNNNLQIDNKIYARLIWRSIWSAEYSVIDVIRYLEGIKSAKSFLDQNNILDIDLFKEIPETEVPLFIMSGLKDIFTSPEITRSWFDFIQSPFKKFYVFENSTHFPAFEEPELFHKILIEDVRALAMPGSSR